MCSVSLVSCSCSLSIIKSFDEFGGHASFAFLFMVSFGRQSTILFSLCWSNSLSCALNQDISYVVSTCSNFDFAIQTSDATTSNNEIAHIVRRKQVALEFVVQELIS